MINFIVTDNAIKQISFLLKQDNNKGKIGFRVAVDGGGCSGFMYQYNLIGENNINKDDMIFSHSYQDQKINVYIDEVSSGFLNNCTLDFIQELGSSYFNISNPSATAKCGCGNSFAV